MSKKDLPPIKPKGPAPVSIPTESTPIEPKIKNSKGPAPITLPTEKN